MSPEHNCFDHLEYDSRELDDSLDEWYRCTICFRILTIAEGDRMVEAEAEAEVTK